MKTSEQIIEQLNQVSEELKWFLGRSHKAIESRAYRHSAKLVDDVISWAKRDDPESVTYLSEENLTFSDKKEMYNL